MIVLGLGSNFGDRPGNLRSAVRALRSGELRHILQVKAVSPIYESEAMLLEGAEPGWDQPFLNLAVLAEWSNGPLDPSRLLARIKALEARLGRQARGRWAPREIDIDILLIDSLVVATEELEIPHAGLLKRPFALLPVADLCPDWRYPAPGPAQGRSARELCGDWLYGSPDAVPFQVRRTPLALTELMGIINLTPDSFSSDGLSGNPGAAIERARSLIRSGATVLDLGAESTRPGAVAVEPRDEWSRLRPVLELLGGMPESGVKVSLDTRHSWVARQALALKAPPISWINDVTGGEDPELCRVVADSEADLVFMNSLGLPPARDRVLPLGRDPVAELIEWAGQRIRVLERAGIPRERLIFDPGIGFGKTPEQSLLLLRESCRFHELGVRILIGHSRKSFLRKWDAQPDRPARERDHETSVLSEYLAAMGVDYLRVHDVDRSRRALEMFALMDGVARW